MAVFRKENGSLVRKAGKALIDMALNANSNNAVANKVIKAKFDEVDAEINKTGDFVEATITEVTVANKGTIATISLNAGTWLVNGYAVASGGLVDYRTAIRHGSIDYRFNTIILVLNSSANITLENVSGGNITSYADKRFTNLQAVRIK